MEATVSSSSRPLLVNTKTTLIRTRNRVIKIPAHQFSVSKSKVQYPCRRSPPVIKRRIKGRSRNHVSAAADIDIARVDITWQIIIGAMAGVTPFVVAGIEFTKRIMAQRRCEACGGSGLVLRDKDYFRCPGCGGFLPWQSWKRFFSG